MIESKDIKKILKNFKNVKAMESIVWNEEFDEKIQFLYFTYQIKPTSYSHIMLIVVFSKNKIETEAISTYKNENIIEFSNHLIEECQKALQKKEKETIQFKKGINKNRFMKYLKNDKNLKKKLERYLKK